MFIGGSPRIFVSVAAYRDSETPNTIKSLLEAADRPYLIRIGILNQLCTQQEGLYKVGSWTNVHECIIDYTQSKGACWARSFIWTNLLQDEEFVLQIDSHSRFDKGWDTALLKMFERLNDPLAVLTHYPMPYNSLTGERSEQQYTRFDVQSFNHWGFPVISSAALPFTDTPVVPAPTAVLAGGCFFTRGKTVKNVPYDPYLYFQGEEINYAIRLFTHGYNLYLPNQAFMYHDYGSNRGRRLHWNDGSAWERYNVLSVMRNRHLLDLETASDPEALTEIERYGLGKRRSLSDWERFAGINLRNKTITTKAKTGAF